MQECGDQHKFFNLITKVKNITISSNSESERGLMGLDRLIDYSSKLWNTKETGKRVDNSTLFLKTEEATSSA